MEKEKEKERAKKKEKAQDASLADHKTIGAQNALKTDKAPLLKKTREKILLQELRKKLELERRNLVE